MSEFDKLKAKLLSRGALFEDPEFPASSRSLRSDGRVDRNIRWRRPQEIVRNPVFIEKESSRFDLDQGQLGDCWFISAVSSLACSNRKLLQRCVPHDQSFSQDYAGIFLFKFWSFDTWVEVFVDDRLPTIGGRLVYGRNIDEPNEFWVALLEKAYAKLYKRYENLDGGHVNDALVDLTGGISERIELKNNAKLPDNLFELMYRTLQMNSMCGSSINAKVRREVDLGNGLYTGHAYSINNMLQTKVRGRTVKLIRLRNPWGRKEWRGAWSDSSYEWTSISDTEKRDIGLVTRDDGEFWMEFGEWQRSFDAVSFCHLHPDALTAEVAQDMQKRNWEVTTVHDGWVKGFSAGGCGNSPYQGELCGLKLPDQLGQITCSRWPCFAIKVCQIPVKKYDNNLVELFGISRRMRLLTLSMVYLSRRCYIGPIEGILILSMVYWLYQWHIGLIVGIFTSSMIYWP